MRDWGEPSALAAVELPDPQPGPGEVAIDVRAAGCNFGDLLIVQGRYQFRPPRPFSPGSEVCGVVTAVGQGVENSRLGERVFGLLRWGGYSSRVVLPSVLAVPLPGRMSFEEGAGFGVAYQTAHLAFVERGRLARGETVLVHGAAGGVGLAAVELGKSLGARVIATARGDAKLKLAAEHGADVVIDSDDEWKDEVLRLTEGDGVDVVCDPIGGETFGASTKCVAFCGRILVIGFASGEIPEMRMNRVMLKNISIVGVNWGAYRDDHPERLAEVTAELFSLYENGSLRPVISSVYPLEEAPRALAELADRKSVGKVVLSV